MASELDVVVVIPELTSNVKYPELTSNVNIPGVQPNNKSSLTTNVTVGELNTAVTTPKLASAVQQTTLTAAVSGVTNSTPTPGLFTRALDTVTTSNPVSISIEKPFTENISAVETVSVLLTYNRNLTELINTSELFTVGVDKLVSDATAVSLTEYKLVQKLADTPTITQDINFLQVTKPNIDQVVNDSINTLDIYKQLTEALTNTEYTQFSITKLFEDSVDATDDYYGAANLDDDQYAFFGKTLVDYLGTSEIQIYVVGNKQQDTITTADQNYSVFTKLLADITQNAEDISAYFSNVTIETVAVQETAKLNVSLTKSDQFNFSDVFSTLLNYNRNLTEQVQTSETNEFNISIAMSDLAASTDSFSSLVSFNRTSTDAANFTEYSVFSLVKIVRETTNSSDTNRLSIEKYLIDFGSFTEIFTREVNYLRSFEELIDATDDYYGAATVGDDEYASFNKVIADSINISTIETSTFASTKILADTSTISEQSAISITKPVTDTNTTTENLTAAVSKIFSDSIAKTDVTYLNLETIKSDTTNIFDSLAVLIIWTRSFADALTGILDNTNFSINLNKQEVVSNSEVFTTNLTFNRSFTDAIVSTDSSYFNTSNLLLDTSNVAEAKAISITRPLSHSITSSELLIKQVNYQRTLLDTVDATDDYYGAATVGDDEYVSFNKGLVETVLSLDATYFSSSNELTDTITNTSTSYYTFTKPNSDAVDISEQIRKQPNVLLLDVSTTSETKYFDTSLIKLDTATTGEIFSRTANYIRSYSDIGINTDSAELTVQLSKQDLITTSSADVFSTLVGYVKNYFDTTNTSENLAKVLSKFLSDVGQTAETNYLQVQKYFADTVSKSDTITTSVGYLRSFQDMVDATDDYYGAATVGDDEYAQFNKVATDTTITSETRYVSATKILNDQAAGVDSKAATVGKILADSTTITSIDYITRGSSKTLQDAATTAESNIFNTGKYLTDATITSESKYFNVAKYLIDVATSSEQFVRSVNKILQDSTTSIPESASFSVSKYSADTANKSDTQQSSIQPKQFETVHFADILTFLKSGGYTFTDSIHSTDSGAVYNQNYFASSYVTPGYTGTITYFGT